MRFRYLMVSTHEEVMLPMGQTVPRKGHPSRVRVRVRFRVRGQTIPRNGHAKRTADAALTPLWA